MLQSRGDASLPLADEIASAEAACRLAIDAEYSGLGEAVPSMPNTPHACFKFLSGIHYDVRRSESFNSWNTAAAKACQNGGHAAERYLVLQACLASLPLVPVQPVDESVKRLFCTTCRAVAAPEAAVDERFSHRNDAFAELAQIVTLRRHHAGQLSFDITRITYGTLAWWCLTIHPSNLFRFLWRLIIDVRLIGPVIEPHLCYWRQKRTYMLKKEQELSLLRIAKSMELDSRIKGIATQSWLYSRAVGRFFPHLAWVRGFFAEQGSYVADLGPARSNEGFLVGSRKRRQLYAQGTFRPRQTVVLWRSRDVLGWAEAFGRSSARNRRSPRPSAEPSQAIGEGAPRSRLTLLDCSNFMEHNTLLYAALVLFVPAVLAAFVATSLGTAGLGLLAFAATAALMWLFQYYFLH